MAEVRTEGGARRVLNKLFARDGVLADGAMGTILCERGTPIELCLDELNLSHPAMVGVYAAHLQAGAEIATTCGSPALA